MIMFCNGGAQILFFSLLPWHCWCCIFHYLFSISTHGRPAYFFLLFSFSGIFQETQKHLSSARSLRMQCWNGDSAKPDLARQYSSVQRETQTFPSLFSSACYHSSCLAPVWLVRFLPLLLSNSDFTVVPSRKAMCQIQLNLESEFTGRYWFVLIPDGLCSVRYCNNVKPCMLATDTDLQLRCTCGRRA